MNQLMTPSAADAGLWQLLLVNDSHGRLRDARERLKLGSASGDFPLRGRFLSHWLRHRTLVQCVVAFSLMALFSASLMTNLNVLPNDRFFDSDEAWFNHTTKRLLKEDHQAFGVCSGQPERPTIRWTVWPMSMLNGEANVSMCEPDWDDVFESAILFEQISAQKTAADQVPFRRDLNTTVTRLLAHPFTRSEVSFFLDKASGAMKAARSSTAILELRRRPVQIAFALLLALAFVYAIGEITRTRTFERYVSAGPRSLRRVFIASSSRPGASAPSLNSAMSKHGSGSSLYSNDSNYHGGSTSSITGTSSVRRGNSSGSNIINTTNNSSTTDDSAHAKPHHGGGAATSRHSSWPWLLLWIPALIARSGIVMGSNRSDSSRRHFSMGARQSNAAALLASHRRAHAMSTWYRAEFDAFLGCVAFFLDHAAPLACAFFGTYTGLLWSGSWSHWDFGYAMPAGLFLATLPLMALTRGQIAAMGLVAAALSPAVDAPNYGHFFFPLAGVLFLLLVAITGGEVRRVVTNSLLGGSVGFAVMIIDVVTSEMGKSSMSWWYSTNAAVIALTLIFVIDALLFVLHSNLVAPVLGEPLNSSIAIGALQLFMAFLETREGSPAYFQMVVDACRVVATPLTFYGAHLVLGVLVIAVVLAGFLLIFRFTRNFTELDLTMTGIMTRWSCTGTAGFHLALHFLMRCGPLFPVSLALTACLWVYMRVDPYRAQIAEQVKDAEGGDTPLHVLVRRRDWPAVTVLVEAGVDVSRRNGRGFLAHDMASDDATGDVAPPEVLRLLETKKMQEAREKRELREITAQQAEEAARQTAAAAVQANELQERKERAQRKKQEAAVAAQAAKQARKEERQRKERERKEREKAERERRQLEKKEEEEEERAAVEEEEERGEEAGPSGVVESNETRGREKDEGEKVTGEEENAIRRAAAMAKQDEETSLEVVRSTEAEPAQAHKLTRDGAGVTSTDTWGAEEDAILSAVAHNRLDIERVSEVGSILTEDAESEEEEDDDDDDDEEEGEEHDDENGDEEEKEEEDGLEKRSMMLERETTLVVGERITKSGGVVGALPHGIPVSASSAVSTGASGSGDPELRRALQRITELEMQLEYSERVQLAAAAKKQREVDEETMCVLCMSGKREVAVLSCGHLCMCTRCSFSFNEASCPLCYEDVVASVRIFCHCNADE